jgi:hypothetical protein
MLRSRLRVTSELCDRRLQANHADPSGSARVHDFGQAHGKRTSLRVDRFRHRKSLDSSVPMGGEGVSMRRSALRSRPMQATVDAGWSSRPRQ